MVSQPGVSNEAGNILKMMSGTLFDEDLNPLSEKNFYAPFETEIRAYRFCAMVGLALNQKSNNGIQTKWSASSPDLANPKLDQLIKILGDEIDQEDWVQAMNQAADWGAIYVKKYYYIGGDFLLSKLVDLLHSEGETLECKRCGAYNNSLHDECWTGCGGSL